MYQFLMIDPQTQDLFATLECSEILAVSKAGRQRVDPFGPPQAKSWLCRACFFRVCWRSRAEFEVSCIHFARPRGSQQEEEAPLPDDVARTGLFFMKLLRCESCINGREQDLDPYVVFSVGCRTKQSTVKRHTFNPIWDPPESFELLVADYSTTKNPVRPGDGQ
ncbi:hypothetical protein Pcac1_g17447 [Phytophthora cactorum]|nr:hypothetical protein Pcac1_g17447 [Phytophthora cactorum]